jgi:hypothetical protein
MQKRKWQPQKNKNDIKACLNQLPNIHILKKKTQQVDG